MLAWWFCDSQIVKFILIIMHTEQPVRTRQIAYVPPALAIGVVPVSYWNNTLFIGIIIPYY